MIAKRTLRVCYKSGHHAPGAPVVGAVFGGAVLDGPALAGALLEVESGVGGNAPVGGLGAAPGVAAGSSAGAGAGAGSGDITSSLSSASRSRRAFKKLCTASRDS